MIYCVLLNPAIDVTYSIEGLELGETKTDIVSEIHPAGKGINILVISTSISTLSCVIDADGLDEAVAAMRETFDLP